MTEYLISLWPVFTHFQCGGVVPEQVPVLSAMYVLRRYVHIIIGGVSKDVLH